MTCAMLALTVGLGVWQVHRLAWKTALLAAIDRGEAAAPVPLPPDPEPFRRVAVHGRFLPSVARYGAEVRDGPAGPAMGSQVLGVLVRNGAPPLIVDRGWAPEGAAAPPLPGETDVVGYVRPPDRAGLLSVSDDVAKLHFYTLDPARIGAAMGQPGVAPFTLVALGDAVGGPPGTVPEPAARLPRPPNDHLQYAITWFSLSAALLAVFATYARQQRRARPETKP